MTNVSRWVNESREPSAEAAVEIKRGLQKLDPAAAMEALLKLYLGQSLQQDLAKLFSERILDTTAQVLAIHIESEEEISAILREIRGEAVG